MKTCLATISITLGVVALIEAAPGISNETVTDVTPRGFSVVWTSDEPATASLEVFSDPAGTTSVPDAVITAHPTENGSDAVRLAAEDLGVMKANVSNLAADTDYYCRTISVSKEDLSVTSGPLVSVRTANLPLRALASPVLTPLANPLLKFDLFLPDGTTPAAGGLLIIEVPGAVSPVSAFSGGSCRPVPTVIVDLNNLYDASTGNTLAIAGGEAVNLVFELGSHGREEIGVFLPPSDSLARMHDPWLTPDPLAAPLLVPRVSSAGLAQMFLDFPVTSGHVYEVQYSHSLGAAWTAVEPAIPAEGTRLFWYDNGEPGTVSPPQAVPARFYRLNDLSAVP